MAEGLKMSENHYNQFEEGKAAPGYDFFYRLMKKYRVSPDYLFYGNGLTRTFIHKFIEKKFQGL